MSCDNCGKMALQLMCINAESVNRSKTNLGTTVSTVSFLLHCTLYMSAQLQEAYVYNLHRIVLGESE